MKGMGLILVLGGSLALVLGGVAAVAPAITTLAASVATTEPVAVHPPTPTTRPREKRPASRKSAHAEIPSTQRATPAEDWAAAQKFIKEHSPRRWEALESLQPDSNARLKIQAYILERYHNLMDQEKKDPSMYRLELKEMELEDQIFGLVSGHRRHRNEDTFEEDLKKVTGSLVDTRLAMRQLRITRLEKTISIAKARLQKDKENRDQLVEREMRLTAKHTFSSRHREEGSRDQRTPKPTTRRAAKPPVTQPAQ